MDGTGNPENVYKCFKVINDVSKGISVPQGTFTNCSTSRGLVFNTIGEYHLENCFFSAKNNQFTINDVHGAPAVTIEDSTFTLTEKMGYGAAVYIRGTVKTPVKNNSFTAKTIDKVTLFLKVGPCGPQYLPK